MSGVAAGTTLLEGHLGDREVRFLDALRPRLEPGTAVPLYVQLVEELAAAIEGERLKEGEALPPERILSERLGVSRTTVRKALEELVDRGLVVTRHGAGNFIGAARLQQPLAALSSFSEDMRARGREPGFTWVERGVFAASPEEIVALALTGGEKVARLVRVRLADGEPLAVERAAIATRHLPDPRMVRSSLYVSLREQGLKPVRALQRLHAAAAGEVEAGLLRIAPGSPVMATVRHSYLADGRPIEFTRSIYRGDRYDFVAEMRQS